MNDLTQLMELATDDLRPDVAELVSGGMTRGRRLRTRRRLAAGLGAAATVAAVGVTAVVVPSYVGGSADSAHEPGVAAAPTIRQRPAVHVLPLPSELARGRVISLPAGSTLIRAWGSRKQAFVAAAWRYAPASGGGAGRVEVLIERLDGLERGPADPATACHEDPGHCVRQPDGAWLSTFTSPEPLSGGGDSEIIGAHASLWTADGLHLTATAYNAMAEKHTEVTRAAPVLDSARLADLLRNAQLD